MSTSTECRSFPQLTVSGIYCLFRLNLTDALTLKSMGKSAAVAVAKNTDSDDSIVGYYSALDIPSTPIPPPIEPPFYTNPPQNNERQLKWLFRFYFINAVIAFSILLVDLYQSWQYPKLPISIIVSMLLFAALLCQIIINAIALSLLDTQADGHKRPRPPMDWPLPLRLIAWLIGFSLRIISNILFLETAIIAVITVICAVSELVELIEGSPSWEGGAVYAVHLIIYSTIAGAVINNRMIIKKFPGWFSLWLSSESRIYME